MNTKQALGLGLMLALLTPAALADGLEIRWKYREATTGAMQAQEAKVVIPASGVTDQGIHKTIFVARLAETFGSSLKAYHDACQTPVLPDRCRGGIGIPELELRCMPPKPVEDTECMNRQQAVAETLYKRVSGLTEEVSALGQQVLDQKVAEAIDLLRQLAANMKKLAGQRQHYFYEDSLGAWKGGQLPRSAPGAAGGLAVTAGGAKDIGFVRKLVEDGRVPPAEALTVEGFMSEFELPLESQGCSQLICVRPAVAIEPAQKRLFVQIGMDSSVTAETFRRKPLNLSLVIDISGSMSATDDTEKNRLEWAKEAAIHAIQSMGTDDTVSIVTFDTTARVLVSPVAVTDKAALIAKVKALETGGSTNLEAGLRKGYEFASVQARAGFENRLILISDAGLNTGVTNEASVMKLVGDFAAEGVGLTAIGLGENFNQSFIHHITMSRGGNYIFVQSGAKMYEYFKQFDFLVSPVAYDFKALIGLDGIDAKLVRAYGVPMEPGQAVQELLDIRTLFFAGSGGGAILLEYALGQ